MKLFRANTRTAILLEGEGGVTPQSFQVGAMVGSAKITEIEVTALGTIVRREGDARDLIIWPEHGQLLDKQRAEPAHLQERRK